VMPALGVHKSILDLKKKKLIENELLDSVTI
jgi:hypothetical protein